MKIRRHEWRDAQEWEKLGLKFTCTSNETLKLYDAALTQYVGWYDDDEMGGLSKTATALLESNPDWVMGHVMVNGLDLVGTGRSPLLDPGFKVAVDKMVALAAQQAGSVSDLEKHHVEALSLFAQGYMNEACEVWERILLTYPQDMLALKFAQDSYFYLGLQAQMRDSVARVIPHWKPSMPLYSYLYGMHSFGLVETNFYTHAETVARKGLELNPCDAWSTHSLAHVLEMMGRPDEGIAFMSSTLQDWQQCGMLSCHNFWHWAVYHIEKGEYQGAFDLYDSQIGVKANKSSAMLDIVDAASLLYRLELEGQNVEGRWKDIYETCRPHMDDHLLCFNDVHFLFTSLGARQEQSTKKLLDSIEHFIREGSGNQRDVMQEVGQAICRALVAYDRGDPATATDILAPLRYKVLHIGGSNAQRDVLNIFLINAAMKSDEVEHKRLARHMLSERKALKENSPLTERMMARALALHVD